jgi:hypothetical protein
MTIIAVIGLIVVSTHMMCAVGMVCSLNVVDVQ